MKHWRAVLAAAVKFRANPHLFGYALGKAWLDPAYPTVARALSGSALPLLDLGCGAGHLAAYLRARGFSAPISGVDLDPRKVEAARLFLQGMDCEFVVGHAETPPAHCGHVCALDVIHYFAPEQQRIFVGEVVARLAEGGMGFLRLTLRDGSWRFRISAMEERWIKRLGWIPWTGESFPTREQVSSWAAETGCRWSLSPLWGATPFNSYLLEFRR